MQNRLAKGIAHAIAVLMLVSTLFTGLTAFGSSAGYADDGDSNAPKAVIYNADGTGTAISDAMTVSDQSASTDSHIWYGTKYTEDIEGSHKYMGSPYWRVLNAYRDDSGSTKANGKTGRMFLISEYAWFGGQYSRNEAAYAGSIPVNTSGIKDWKEMNAKSWSGAFYDKTFSEAEKAAIPAITKDKCRQTNTAWFQGNDDSLSEDYVYYPSVDNILDYFGGLTAGETKVAKWVEDDHPTDTYNAGYEPTVTRSAVGTNYTGCVFGFDKNTIAVAGNYGAYAARPAFNIDLSKVLLVSTAGEENGGGKAAGAGGLSPVGENSTGEWKLTVNDSNLSLTTGDVTDTDEAYEIEYSDASTGENTYLSAVLLDENDAVKSYGRLVDLSSDDPASGKVTIPKASVGSDDTLSLFVEKVNGSKTTDFASEPVVMSLDNAVTKVDIPEGETFTYDGTAKTGVASGAFYSLTGQTETNAGTYTAKATLKTTKTADGNLKYQWTDGTTEPKEITWTIDKCPVTIKAPSTEEAVKSDQIGDEPLSGMSATIEGKPDAGANLVYELTTSAKKGVPAGSYPIQVIPGENPNYEITTVDGEYKVANPDGEPAEGKDINLEIKDYEGVYDGKYHGITVTVTGEDAAKATVYYNGRETSNKVKEKNVGVYPIKYTVQFENNIYSEVKGTAYIKITPAPLTAKYVDETITEGEAPALEVNVEGFVNGESASTAAGYTAPTVTASDVLTGGNTYELTPAGGSADNYTFTYEEGTLTVNKKSSGGGGGGGAATDPVQKVVDEINALPTPVTEANKAAVEQARKDYNDLTDEQKKDSRLTDEIMKKLTDAEKVIAAADDQKAADAATKLIEAIPDKITESDVDTVKKAQEAYDKLTDAQKALVSEADKTKLENAVKDIRIYQKGEDGTALGTGASWEAAEKAILGMTSDADPAGSKLMPLKVKSVKQTKKSIKVQYTKPTGAVKYVIYGNKCGKKNKMKRLKTTMKASINFKKIAGKKVKKGTSYKFIVVALDKDNNVVSTSKVVHAVTKGTKKGNPTKLKVKNPKSLKKTLAAGKSFTIKSNVGKKKGTKIKLHVAKSYRGLRYESSNPVVAKVSKSGKVTAVSAGTAKIIVYTQNGINKTITVTVK